MTRRRPLAAYDSWAIDTRSAEGHGLVGIWWWFGRRPAPLPPHVLGCRAALFATRRQAREALPHVREAFPAAMVVRVRAVVEPL